MDKKTSNSNASDGAKQRKQPQNGQSPTKPTRQPVIKAAPAPAHIYDTNAPSDNISVEQSQENFNSLMNDYSSLT